MSDFKILHIGIGGVTDVTSLVTGMPSNLPEEELQGFDIENVLKAPCLISTTVGVSKQGKEFARVSSVGKLPKGMLVPKETENPTVVFDVTNRECPLELMEQLPEWVQTRIKDSLEYKARTTSDDDFIVVDDEDLPFE